jgi:hypothetical protein
MIIKELLRKQGWELVPRVEWIAIQDLRPEFYDVFKTRRLAKLIGTDLYITLTGCPVMTRELIVQVGGTPKTIKSKNKLRDVAYLGFDTSLVSHDNLGDFVRKVAGFIDDLL